MTLRSEYDKEKRPFPGELDSHVQLIHSGRACCAHLDLSHYGKRPDKRDRESQNGRVDKPNQDRIAGNAVLEQRHNLKSPAANLGI